MKIGHNLRGGETIELIGDLGAGKTAFVRGLAEGMGSRDRVSSPSFTIGNQYRAGKLTLHHFDFHRLSEPGIMHQEVVEVLEDPKAVVAVEWADTLRDTMPDNCLSVSIRATGEVGRQFTFSYPEKLSYLMPGNI